MKTTMSDSRIALNDLNGMEEERFVRLLGAVFEHSPWVASAAFARRPFENLAELHEAMMRAVLSSSDDTVLQFLCTHPELAGREMQEGKLTENSSLEQARAGLDALAPEEFRCLNSLNAEYRARHGFPFIACVRHYTKEGIFYELSRRLDRSTAEERRTALEQIAAISRIRLEALVRDE